MEDKLIAQITKEGSTAVVTFASSSISDVQAIADISKQINQFINAEHPTRFIFDFTGVKFFSSQVLGMLLETRAKLIDLSGEVLIAAINPQLYRVFKITNLDKLFRFFPKKVDALNAPPPDQIR